MVVLASKSPRRKELLGYTGIEFIICPAEDEKNPEKNLPPEEYASFSALYKARNVAEHFTEDDIIIGADTIVYSEGKIIGKPRDKQDAYDILKSLSGRTHCVYTGYAIIKGETEIIGCEKTFVTFRKIEDDEIYAYIATGKPMDKAGAYGAQDMACAFIEKVNGDFFNVVGLPVCRIVTELKKIK